MFRTIFTLLLMTSLNSAFAGEYFKVDCHSVEMPGLHTFDAYGSFEVLDASTGAISGSLNISTLKAGDIHSVQIFNDVELRGKIISKVDAQSGNIRKELVVAFDHGYIFSGKFIFKNLEHSEKSRIYSVDNFIFNSFCTIQ